MARKKKEPNRVDDLLDDLLADCQSPEDILGESGLLKQLSQRLNCLSLSRRIKPPSQV
jgi:hypothetical protein